MSGVAYAIGVVLFFLGLVVSIGLHEVGHLVSAKAFGVKVTQYFVGFGRTLWSTRRGETEYGVKLFPVGGFVKIVGMLPPEPAGRRLPRRRGYWGKVIADARAAEYHDIGPEDSGRLFYQRPGWQKLVVMLCGPATNLVLAFLILAVVFIGIGVSKATLTVSQVSDCVVPASQGGRACTAADPAAPARAAGFRAGDRILSVDGTPMRSWDQFSEVTRRSAGQTMTVVVSRDGHDVTVRAHPIVNQLESLSNPTQYVKGGFLGLMPDQVRQREGPAYVARTIGDYTVRTAVALGGLPGKMVGVAEAAVGAKPRNPESPMSVVGATRLAGQVASDQQVEVIDRVAFALTLLGLVNLFVALFNFIPLLPLDGGHMAGAIYEALRRLWARLRRHPDPGYADVARMLPLAYTIAGVLIVLGVILVWADIVSPVRLPTG